ncbi:MAG: class I SAM-dependent methyltransferase [Proteobacteria bacterium]|nr:class I SAM-dependent methyltransferase [Pseudomonadota bacterium]
MKIGTTNEETRREWVIGILKSLPQNYRLLDAGAGEMMYKAYCSHLDYVSQDFCKYEGIGDGKALQSNIWDSTKVDIISDIIDIPEPDSSFDTILCTEVFEHLPDPIKALREFHRLVRKGGNIIITAPFCSLSHLTPFHYFSGFNSHFFKKHFNDMGFEIIEMVNNGNFFEYLSQEIWRLPEIAKRYAGKRILPWEKLVIYMMQYVLQRLTKHDQGSQELLCFGYHVFARKV